MKTWYFLALLLALLGGLVPVNAQTYTTEELTDLVGAVALYPDPLLTSVLIATSQPAQIQAAYDYVIRDGHPDISHQGWDESVKALCSYREVLTLLGESPDYVGALGWAMAQQPEDVADAVQRYRYQVKSAGNLQSDDKVQVMEEGVTIRILPTNPEVIYVPTYDSVEIRKPNQFGRFLAYSAGVAANVLLWKNILDWDDRRFYRPPSGWVPPRDYYRPFGWKNHRPGGTVWRPNTTIVNRPININNIQISQGNNNRFPISPNRPNWNRPGRPGLSSNRPGGSQPGWNQTNKPNRPGANKPDWNKPGRPGVNNPNWNRPGRPGVSTNRPSGNRPGWNKPNRPQVLPAQRPTVKPGRPNRPQARPDRPQTRPAQRPITRPRPTRPVGQPAARPRPRPRPAVTNYTHSSTATRASRRGARSRGTGSLPSGGRPGKGIR